MKNFSGPKHISISIESRRNFVCFREETRVHDAYSDERGLLSGFLEKLKQKMRKGDEKLGIPVLDPLKVNQLNLNVHEKEIS